MIQAFGDEHTRRKLDVVESYLRAYTTALKKKNFELLYVDACAGSGFSIPKAALAGRQEGQEATLMDAEVVADTEQMVMGSALRALGVQPPFDRYLFNDLKRSNVRALEAEVKSRYVHLANRVTITQVDANEMLLDICRRTHWKSSRAVVFIDPFGLQIKYETLEALGRTEAVDLWFLAPVFAMYRQVRGDGEVLDDGGRSVDEALGTDAWRNVVAITENKPPDLFGYNRAVSKRAVDVAWFEKVTKDRLKLAFGDRVLEQALPLGPNGLHVFSLMFAWANPSDRARLASTLAAAVLK